MAKTVYSLVLLLGLFFFSCADRDRNNPLDPLNPVTQGRVTGLVALGLEKKVELSWNALPVSDLTAYLVYRRCGDADSAQFTEIGRTGVSTFADTTVVDGADYCYYVTAQAGDYESPASEQRRCTPGPTFTWVADQQSGYLYCLSHDLRAGICKFGLLSYPRIVAVSRLEHAAYVALRYGEQVFKVNQDGRLLAQLSGVDNVVDMAVDQSQSSLWIAQRAPGRVRLFNETGQMMVSISDLSAPAAIKADNLTHTCWLIDRGSKELLQYSAWGVRINHSGPYLMAPKDLALSPRLQKVWIADSTRVIEYDYNALPTGRAIGGLVDAALIAFNHEEQSLWFVDWERTGQPARLYKVRHDFQIEFSTSAFGYPYEIAVNEFDGSCLVADISWDHYGLYRISSSGNKIERIGDYSAPFAVAVENRATELSP